jgi:hypothetical protein
MQNEIYTTNKEINFMKKLNLSLLIILVSISIIGFVGCKDPEPAHEHEFSDSWSKVTTGTPQFAKTKMK